MIASLGLNIDINRSCYIDGLLFNNRLHEMNLFLRRGFIAALALLPLTLAYSIAFADEVDVEALAEARALMKSGR